MMESIGINDAKNSASSRKIAQLYTVVKNNLDYEYIKKILQSEESINDDMSKFVNLRNCANCNLLDLAFCADSIDMFHILLNHGADFTAKNKENQTIVHRIIQDKQDKHELFCNKFESDYIDAALYAHIRFGNISNPHNEYNISHFHAACLTNNVDVVKFFLLNGVSVDQPVSQNSPFFPSYTPLHFAARYSCLETAEILLKYKANIHLKDAIGMKPLDLLIERLINEIEWEAKVEYKTIIEILVKHEIDVSKNASATDNFGLSSLHAACILQDTSIVKSILEKTVDTNKSINSNSPFCPGYTPLHFAAIFNIDTVKLLISNGANIEIKDTDNVTPLDLCLQRYTVTDIHFILLNNPKWRDIMLSDNKTRLLDLISAMISADMLGEFLTKIESNMDLIVPIDSPLWSGYTVLHLAIIFTESTAVDDNSFGWPKDLKKVEECLTRGADVTKADAHNSTPLHLAFYLQKFRVVELLLSHHGTVENPFDNNNLSHFHIACAAMDEKSVARFLSNGVDVNVSVSSTIKWHVLERSNLNYKPRYLFITPGSTALHINVACGNITITKMLLEYGANIYAKDVNGFTPIHRLLTSCTSFFENIDGLLLNLDGLQDCFAEGGLSHLHVACHLNNPNAVEKLLDRGADINALITHSGDETTETIQKWHENEYYFDPYGDPSKGPLSFLACYSGFTPLHFSMETYKINVKMIVLQRGADILAGNSSIYAPVCEIFGGMPHYNNIIPVIMNNNTLMSRLKNQLGLTMLHIACYINNLDLVKDLLSQGENVNVRVHTESPIWAGYTPLHILAMKAHDDENSNLIELIELMLVKGADITSKDCIENTPLHLLDATLENPLASSTCTRLLLRSITDFKSNTTNSQGISFFHLACIMKDAFIVEEFLKHKVDPNRNIDYFSDRYPGCSPLHLAAGYRSELFDGVDSQLQTIDLLLKHGADVRVKDAYENTLLHNAAGCGSSRDILFEIFISNGVDVNDENILGETPLEILIKSGNARWEEIECLLKHGCRINSYNSVTEVGYIARLFTNPTVEGQQPLANDIVIQKLLDSEYIVEVDDIGRTALHNAVAINCCSIDSYVELIEQLVECGCDINYQDKNGRTALHIATWYRNDKGVSALLKNGIDINLTDKEGKTAFAYSFEPAHHRSLYENHHDPNHVINIFAMHVHKMEVCGLYISEDNLQFQQDALEKYYLQADVLKCFHNNIKKSKNIKIGSTSLTLYNFSFNAEMIYPNLLISERLEIDKFFENINQHHLNELDYLLKLLYKAASKRHRLIKLAVTPLDNLLKNQLPDLCCRTILSFLSSTDLENLIASANFVIK